MSDSSPPPTPAQAPPASSRARPQPQPKPQAKKPLMIRQARPHQCVVHLLDGEVLEMGLSKKASGNELFVKVCEHLDLVEREYFGLVYKDDQDPAGTRFWLDVNKSVSHQKRRGKWEFEFAVKFYPPDPTVLKEALTRYLVCCQIRIDIVSGRLPCTFATQAVLGSFFVQGDLGDWDPDEHGEGIDYLRNIPFAPTHEQTPALLDKIAELHKDRKGMTPEQAEMQYLEYAKKIALYGIHMHSAKDSDFVDIKIGVGASGISIFRDTLRINRFVWPKILKISYRRNKFLLRIRPGEFETFESWIAFKLPTNRLAKRLWKLAIEHHAFLRLREPAEPKRGFLPRFGSKYRYSGRTLYQTRTLTDNRPQPFFERTGSKQYLNNNLNRTLDEFPMKPAGFRDHNLSTTSADDSFDQTPVYTPAERAPVGRIIRDKITEEDQEEPRIIRPVENGQRREEAPIVRPPENVIRRDRSADRESPRPSRPSVIPERDESSHSDSSSESEESPKLVRPSEIKSKIDGRKSIPIPVGPPVLPPTEIRVENRFKRDEAKRRSRDSDDDLDSRLPNPPRDEPRRADQHRGVPTPLAAVGLPSAVLRRPNDSDRGSRSSLDDIDERERRPAPKEKPPTAPKEKPPTAPKPAKPPVAKKPVKMMDM